MADEPNSVLTGFAAAFRLPELALLRGMHWTLSLRPEQITLGSMVISANGPITSFSEAKSETGAENELLSMMSCAERVSNELGADKINFLALMMKDPLLHFHVLPRFRKPVNFLGLTWTDDEWPGPPRLMPRSVDDEQRAELVAVLRSLANG